jgi:acetylornithine deacetylase
MPLQPVERAVRDAIDERGLVETLRALVRIPSVTGDERAAQEWLAACMRESGFDVDFWPIDLQAVRADPSYPGEETERDEAYGLTGAFGATHGPRLILNGHIDVVPPGDRESWHVDPWGAELRDGCVFGRGACDMKGGLAAAFAAIRAVQRAGVRLRGSVQLQSVVGEEDGGIGTLATLRRGHTGGAAVVVEPTELSIIPAQAGALGFALRVPGRAAHACERLAGVSAIEKFWPLYIALERLERRRNTGVDHPLLRLQALPYPLSIGILRAGSWLSTVPDDLEAIGRYGVAIGEDLASARRELEEAVCAAAREDDWLTDHPPRVSWVGGRFAPAETAQSHPFVELLAGCVADVQGVRPAMEGATYGSDLRHFVNEAHMPAVLFGPGGARTAHMIDEFVSVAQVAAVARSLAVLIVRYCGVE